MIFDVYNLAININGKIFNILKNPDLNLSFETKPTQEFVEQIYNKDALYPIKIKGDIDFTSKLTGNINALKRVFKGKNVCLIAPGKSIVKQAKKVTNAVKIIKKIVLYILF